MITDIGGSLSHAAIVARELGIPAVVGCGSATTRLHTGDRVRVEPRLSMRRELSERWTAKLGGGLYNQVLQLVSTEGFSGADFYLPIDETAEGFRLAAGATDCLKVIIHPHA